jgi:hypothetical protein
MQAGFKAMLAKAIKDYEKQPPLRKESPVEVAPATIDQSRVGNYLQEL